MENHGQKRSACEQLDLLEGVKTILLDIEGTTTPFTFAKVGYFDGKLAPSLDVAYTTGLASHAGSTWNHVEY